MSEQCREGETAVVCLQICKKEDLRFVINIENTNLSSDLNYQKKIAGELVQ